VTGRGYDELRGTLASLARERTRRPAASRWFRLPIDRAFNVPGRGVVVTGSVAHGDLSRDADLELWPAGRTLRVRDLQSHNVGRDATAGRMRLAVNLAGVSLDEVSRGHELATPGYLEPTSRMDVWLASLRMPGQELKRRLRVRLHIATRDVLAEPIVASWGQRFIVRDEAATRTLGGGRVLRPVARPWSVRHPPHVDGLHVLYEGAPKQRLEETIRAAGWEAVSARRLAARSGLADESQVLECVARLSSEGRVRVIEGGGARAILHAALLAALARDLDGRIQSHLNANPRMPGVARGEWPGWMPRICPQRLRPAVGELLIALGSARSES
jgi:selenocysteine-specific elongation factor